MLEVFVATLFALLASAVATTDTEVFEIEKQAVCERDRKPLQLHGTYG